MSVRRWPDTLPYASVPGYDLSPQDQAIRTAMEVGQRRVRRITFADLDNVGFEWRMTDPQFRAFRDWHRDRPVSLAGDSDSLAAWTFNNMTRLAGAAVSPDAITVDRLMETAATGAHRASLTLTGAATDAITVLCRATVRAAGRTKARLTFVDRASAVQIVNIDLATGVLSGATGLLSTTVQDRGNGWWRVTWTASTGVGAAAPIMRINALDGTGLASYLGDTGMGLDICEMQARRLTGFDLFVPSDAAGKALGASGGSAWTYMPVATGGGLITAEARFTGPYDANAAAGLMWTVKGQMEVRNA
jgi:hypothetical protein